MAVGWFWCASYSLPTPALGQLFKCKSRLGLTTNCSADTVIRYLQLAGGLALANCLR